jgi:hypothetical protein
LVHPLSPGHAGSPGSVFRYYIPFTCIDPSFWPLSHNRYFLFAITKADASLRLVPEDFLEMNVLHHGLVELSVSFNQNSPRYPDGWEGTYP